MENVRMPIAAGTFYPYKKEDLWYLLSDLYQRVEPDEISSTPKIIIVPHAGYVYSGLTAMKVYKTLKEFEKPSNFIILGTKHTRYGFDDAIAKYKYWETPLGYVEQNIWLSENISKDTDIPFDNAAHEMEHSIEVQLPFIQYIYQKPPKIIPIVLSSYEAADELSSVLVQHLGHNILVISTDMNHYEPDVITRKKDKKAIELIERLDYDGLLKYCREYNVTICGLIPLVCGLMVAKQLKLTPQLIDYSTSSEFSGDYSFSVGYLGMMFY